MHYFTNYKTMMVKSIHLQYKKILVHEISTKKFTLKTNMSNELYFTAHKKIL